MNALWRVILTFHHGFFFAGPSSAPSSCAAALGSLYVEMYFCRAVYSSIMLLAMLLTRYSRWGAVVQKDTHRDPQCCRGPATTSSNARQHPLRSPYPSRRSLRVEPPSGSRSGDGEATACSSVVEEKKGSARALSDGRNGSRTLKLDSDVRASSG